jgi:hypothetical protein
MLKLQPGLQGWVVRGFVVMLRFVWPEDVGIYFGLHVVSFKARTLYGIFLTSYDRCLSGKIS